MGIDAVALLRPKSKSVLRKHTRQLIPLDDGSVLLLTGIRCREFEADTAKARAYLEATFGCPLHKLHDDARGVLMFTDLAEPGATTYDGVVAEIRAQGDGFWVPLTDAPEAGLHALREAKAKAKANAKRSGGREGLFFPFGAREALTDAPLFAGKAAQLEELAGTFVRIAPDTEVWCLLVRRKTPLPSRALTRVAQGFLVFADKSTAIHAKYIESLDAVATRLSNEYAPWIAEHDDARGIPVFKWGVFHRLEGASSYNDALHRLGKDVRWISPGTRKMASKKVAKTVAKKPVPPKNR
jgi:hypothetical protein